MNSTHDAQTFDTKQEAESEIAKMHGWNAEPVQVIMHADENGNMPERWLIKCDGYTFLRTDGFVR